MINPEDCDMLQKGALDIECSDTGVSRERISHGMLVTGNVLDSKAVRGDKKGPPQEFGARFFAVDNH